MPPDAPGNGLRRRGRQDIGASVAVRPSMRAPLHGRRLQPPMVQPPLHGVCQLSSLRAFRALQIHIAVARQNDLAR
eukprot:4411375-Lingulodinium_polyedra.AAC.1